MTQKPQKLDPQKPHYGVIFLKHKLGGILRLFFFHFRRKVPRRCP